MATKSKKYLYNPVTKSVNFLLFMASLGGIIFVLTLLQSSGASLSGKDYMHSRDFARHYSKLALSAVESELLYRDEANILASDQSVADQNADIYQLRAHQKNLEENPSFLYALENSDDGTIITNASVPRAEAIAYIKAFRTSVMYEYHNVYFPEASEMDTDFEYLYYNPFKGNSDYIAEALDEINASEGQNWTLYTAMKGTLTSADKAFYDDMLRYDLFKANQTIYMGLLGIAVVVAMMTLLLMFFLTGRRADGTAFTLLFDRIPLEIQGLLLGIFAIPMSLVVNESSAFLNRQLSVAANTSSAFLNHYQKIGVFSAAILIVFWGASLLLCSMIRLWKCGRFWRSFLTVRLCLWFLGKVKRFLNFVKPPALDDLRKWKVLMWIGLWAAGNLVALLLLLEVWPLGALLAMAINGYSLYWILKVIDDLDGIMTIVHQRRHGEDSDRIATERLQASLKGFGEDLEYLQEGLEAAVEERLKGERMKTELITNVTHDLKTPLTSIISYVALLKGREVMDGEAKKYIQVLDEKSGRLKVLIEQLVEAAKASSGNVTMTMGSVDMTELVRQLYGEYQEIFHTAGLTCIHPELKAPMMVMADAHILYRILDNLMSNVAKYALEGTRVYLTLEETEEHITLALKNISKDALVLDSDALAERFVRGDSARNTEGSGLGISIALSLAKLMGAQLRIETDGDLFKAILQLRKDEVGM